MKSKNSLKVRFLGGVSEIGKNMTALEFNKDIISGDYSLVFFLSGDLVNGETVEKR